MTKRGLHHKSGELWFHIIIWCHPKWCHPKMVTPGQAAPSAPLATPLHIIAFGYEFDVT